MHKPKSCMKVSYPQMLATILACLAAPLPSSHSLSSSTRSLSNRATNRAELLLDPSKRTFPKKPIQENRNYRDDNWYEQDPSLLFDFEESVTSSGFKELQRSAGSDILDAHLQQQLDGISHPNQFLDRHVADATPMEKIAMSSVTQQLPKAAVDALRARATNRKNNGAVAHVSSLQFSTQRVTPDEEIELARTIQKGAALEAAREQQQDKLGRPITRQEWADLTGMSTKELRRQVAHYRQAKHLLVTSNIGLVGAVVNQLWAKNKNRYMGITKEELIQEGSLGLLRAAELFDPSRGLRFSTYAVVWIKGILSNTHVQELVRLPDRERRRWHKIQQAQAELEKQHDGNKNAVTLEMLCSATGFTPQDILFTQRKMLQARSVLSLDYEQSSQSRSGTETQEKNAIQNNLRYEDDMEEQNQLQADVIAAMARNLDAREARLLRLRYGLVDGMTRSLQECAEAMGLSYTRVHQISQQCLRKLREAAEAESLEEYLLTIA